MDQIEIYSSPTSRVKDFLGAVVKINNDGIFHEPSCPFCSSIFRKEAEAVFAKTPQYSTDKFTEPLKFLTEKGEKFTIDVVKNHCLNHVGQGDAQLRKIEYIQTIDNIASIKTSTIQEVDNMLAALKERQFEISKIAPDSRTSRIEVEQIKAGIICNISKSVSNLLVLRAKMMGEMIETGDMLVISRERFKQAFNDILDKAKTDEEKTLIVELLKNLSKLEDKSSS